MLEPTAPSTVALVVAYSAHNHQKGRRHVWPWAAIAVAVTSGVALIYGTSTRGVDRSLQGGLASVAMAWDGMTAWQQPAVHPKQAPQNLRRAALVGDEGFWLSRMDLSGSTAGLVALGDRFSIASKADPRAGVLSDSGIPNQARTFEVVELKPLLDTKGTLDVVPLSGAATVPRPPDLTLVICREVGSNGNEPPRTLRFLMEATADGQPTLPPLPRTL